MTVSTGRVWEAADELPIVQSAERGALFVLQGDLQFIDADVFVLSTDSDGRVEPAWSWLVGIGDDGNVRQLGEEAGLLRRDGGAWLDAHTLPAGRKVFALDTGGEEAENTVQDFGERFGRALRALERHVSGLVPAHRARPLVAMPLVGTGLGMLRGQTGALIQTLIGVLAEHFDNRAPGERSFDVVLVCRTDSDYAAVQFARRAVGDRLEAPEHAWVRTVADHASQGSLAVLFGAGASAGIGLPTWADLLTWLVQQVGSGQVSPDQLKRLDPVDAATVLSEICGKEAFDAAVSDRLGVERHALTHGLIANLRVPLAITTNYDRGYEIALTASKAGAPTVLPWQVTTPHQLALLKLHGDVDEGQIVLSRDDFVAMHAFRRPLSGVLQERMMVGHVLTVGTSMSDATLVHAAEEVRGLITRTREAPRGSSGTVLLTVGDEGRARLLAGTFVVAAAGEAPAPTDSDAESRIRVMEAARRVDVILDWIGIQAASETGFLLDPRYRDLLSEGDRVAAQEVDAFARSLRRAGGAGSGAVGRHVTGFLDSLGWRP